jgi:hypothetical protein
MNPIQADHVQPDMSGHHVHNSYPLPAGPPARDGQLRHPPDAHSQLEDDPVVRSVQAELLNLGVRGEASLDSPAQSMGHLVRSGSGPSNSHPQPSARMPTHRADQSEPLSYRNQRACETRAYLPRSPDSRTRPDTENSNRPQPRDSPRSRKVGSCG